MRPNIFIISVLLSLNLQIPLVFSSEEASLVEARKRMVDSDLKGRDIRDPKVLEIMGKVPRHLFVECSSIRPAATASSADRVGSTIR